MLSTLLAVAVLAAAPEAPAPPASGPVLELGLGLGLPAALPTGLSTGVAAGVATRGPLALGGRASWGTATEHTRTWTVTHQELRLRGTAALQAELGRGVLGLRLGAGGTEVYERRERKQAARLGLTGDDLATEAFRLLPAAELEAVARVELLAALGVGVSAGPAVHWLDGAPLPGFTAGVVVTWRP